MNENIAKQKNKKELIMIMLLSFLLCASCSNGGGNTHTDNKQVQTINDSTQYAPGKQLDLAKLTFKENINTLLKETGLALKDGASEEQTLAGFEVFENNTSALLKYDAVALNGTFQNNINKVVLHYSAKDSLLAMYELKVYSESQSNDLIKHLKAKLGKSTFEKATIDKELAKEKKDFIAWENSNGVNYYLIAVTSLDASPQTVYAELTAIDMKKKGIADWIKFRSFDWYKK